MAHHYGSPDDEGPGFPLPRTLRGRAVVGAVGAPVIALLLVALWLTGGLEPAKTLELKTAEPGKAVKNTLMEIALQEAAVGPDPEMGGYRLQVRAEVESLVKDPVGVSEVGRLLKPHFGRKDLTTESMRMRLVRHPEADAQVLQPGTTEEVVLIWMLAEGDPDATEPKSSEEIFGEDLTAEPDDVSPQLTDVDKVDITVTGAEFEPGFTDTAKRWWEDGTTAGVVALPLVKE